MTTMQKAGKSERRQRGARVHFEALVAVGSAESEGGFDAESVDVSPQGMRLRATNLPEQGERLICRFEADGAEGEVVATGEVSWVSPEEHGGEFGLRFVDLDDVTEQALRAMCAELGGEAEPQPEIVPRGARVRLHIEGLGSPMKARVRASAGGDVEVGSNLEFLKMDRALGIEDVERGTKQDCYVDSVKVEVDPATKVPQLVVGLRFTEDRAAAKTKRVASAADDEAGEEIQAGRAALSTLAGAGSRAKAAGKGALAKVAPALGAVGRTVGGAMRGILERVRQKREATGEVDLADRPAGPRRVTAPPPSGTLRADGRRLIREEGQDEPMMTTQKPRTPKRALMIGGLVGLLALGGVAAASKLGHKAAPLAAAAPTSSVLALPAAAGDGAMANVPLFGATPMSTVEQVPPPAPTAVAHASGDPAPAAGGAAAAGGDDDGELKKDWGEGNAKGGAVLKLKMDSALEGFRASQGDMGFTVVIPGHKFLGNAAELAKKDKRLALFHVTNKPDGAEITVQFKEEVPGHKVKANGSTLEIRFAGDKKVAKKGDKSKKKGDKKKGAKKPVAKKPT